MSSYIIGVFIYGIICWVSMTYLLGVNKASENKKHSKFFLLLFLVLGVIGLYLFFRK